MRHHLRGATHAQPRRGKEKTDPTYLIVDALTNKKMLTVDDILELKNPSARLAKAMVSIRSQKATEKESQGANKIDLLQDVEKFMRDINMWTNKELEELGNPVDSEDEAAELEEETQALLKDKIFERIQNDPRYNEAFEMAMRRGIVNNYSKAKMLAQQERSVASVANHNSSSFSKASSKKNHMKNTDFVRQYIENTPVDKRKKIDTSTFMTSLMEVRENLQDVLQLNEGDLQAKDIAEAIEELEVSRETKKPEKGKPLSSKEVKEEKGRVFHSEKKAKEVGLKSGDCGGHKKASSEVIPVNKKPVVSADGILADVEGYRKQVKKNLVQEEIIEFNERNKLRKLILANGPRESPHVKDYQKEMKNKSNEIMSNMKEWKTDLTQLRRILTINTDSYKSSPLKLSTDELQQQVSTTVGKDRRLQDETPLARLIETYQPQLKALELSSQKTAQMRLQRINRPPLKLRISPTASRPSKPLSLNVSPRIVASTRSSGIKSTASQVRLPLQTFRPQKDPSPAPATKAAMVSLSGMLSDYSSLKTPAFTVIRKRRRRRQEVIDQPSLVSQSTTLLKRRYLHKVAEVYCNQIVDKRRVLAKLDDDN